MTDPYTAAARAEITAKGTYPPDHLLFAQLVELRAGTTWFRAAVDAAIAEQKQAAERWRLEAERLRRINLGALHIANRINPAAGPGQIAADLGNVRLTLASSSPADGALVVPYPTGADLDARYAAISAQTPLG